MLPYIGFATMSKKKQISTPESKLINALSSHFATLPPTEAEDRIKRLREFVNADADGDSRTDDHASPERPDCIVRYPLVARQR